MSPWRMTGSSGSSPRALTYDDTRQLARELGYDSAPIGPATWPGKS